MSDQPPLGLIPSKHWKRKCQMDRIATIIQAMDRYSRALKPIPASWVAELNDLVFEVADIEKFMKSPDYADIGTNA